MTGEIVDYLVEKVKYERGVHCRAVLTSIDYYPIHIHADMQLIYVVQGELQLRVSYDTYNLMEGDMHIVNTADTHAYKSNGKSNVLLILYFETDYFSRFHPNYYGIILFCDENHNRRNKTNVKKILDGMVNILIESNEQEQGFEERINRQSRAILNSLIKHFQYFSIEDRRFSSENRYRGDYYQTQRIQRIIEYFYNNYMNKISLDTIAEQENISKYYLSHLIKYATGYGFQDFISFIRVEQSEKLVLGSDLPMGKIAYTCGFSSTTYLNKHFSYWFGVTPAEYRRKFGGRTILKARPRYFSFDKNEAITALKRALRAESAETERRYISIDTSSRVSASGEAEPPGELLLWDIRNGLNRVFMEELAEYRKIIGVKRIRINGIFRNSDDACDTLGWESCSLLLDKLVEYEINPDLLIEDKLLKQAGFDDRLTAFFSFFERKYGKSVTGRWSISVFSQADGMTVQPELPVFSRTHPDNLPFSVIPAKIRRPEADGVNDCGESAQILCEKLFNRSGTDYYEGIKLVDDMAPYIRTGSFFNGDSGIVSVNGLRKPAYYIHYFLSKMGKTIIDSDSNYVVTADTENYQILFFNSFSCTDFDDPGLSNYFSVNLSGLENRYLIKKHILKWEQSCFQQWKKMGSPAELSDDDIMIIRHNAFPKVSCHHSGSSSTHEITVSLNKRDIMLLTLDRVKEEPLLRRIKEEAVKD